MTILEFQTKCATLVRASGSKDDDPNIAALALCGESGEVANDVKKYLYGRFDLAELRTRTVLELRDVMWYVVAEANALEIDLQTEVIDQTISHIGEKLIRVLPMAANSREVLALVRGTIQ